MVRTYVKKRKATSKEQLDSAVSAIADGRSISSVSKEYSIPTATIRRRLQNPGFTETRLGRRTVFSETEEQELGSLMRELSQLFYGLFPIEARRIAFEFAEKHDIKTHFDKANRVAGKDWLTYFTKRQEGITLRVTRGMSLNTSHHKAELSVFFRNVKTLMEIHNFLPERIYNADETDLSTVLRLTRNLPQNGVNQKTSNHICTMSSVACAFSATGSYIPPMFIFKLLRMPDPLPPLSGPPGSVYTCSESGLMNECIYLDWLEHFQKHSQASSSDPVLLVLDNHSSHISLAAFEFCKDNGIYLVPLPEHSPYRIHPLDMAFFWPLKKELSHGTEVLIKAKPYQPITIMDIVLTFSTAYSKVRTVAKAVSGFKNCGIFPLNPEVLKEMLEPGTSTSSTSESSAGQSKKMKLD